MPDKQVPALKRFCRGVGRAVRVAGAVTGRWFLALRTRAVARLFSSRSATDRGSGRERVNGYVTNSTEET